MNIFDSIFSRIAKKKKDTSLAYQKRLIGDVSRKQTSIGEIFIDATGQTKARDSNGQVKNVIISGTPRQHNSLIYINADTVYAQYQTIHRRYVSGGGKGWAILEEASPSGSEGERLYKLAEIGESPPKIYDLDVYTICGISPSAVTDGTFLTVRFSPNGKHIFVAYESEGGLVSAHPYWGWALDWSVNTETESIVWESLIQKNVALNAGTIGAPAEPDPPSIPATWNPGASSPSEIVTWEVETDPACTGSDFDLAEISYSWVLWDDGDTPRADIIGNWRVEYYRVSSWRGASYGSTTYTYGAVTYDAETDQTYRAVTISDLNTYYYVNGTTNLSFVSPALQVLQSMSSVVTTKPAGPNNALDPGIWNENSESWTKFPPIPGGVPTAPYITPHDGYSGFSASGSLPATYAGGTPASKDNTGVYTTYGSLFSPPVPHYWGNYAAAWYIFEALDGSAPSAEQVKERTATCRYENEGGYLSGDDLAVYVADVYEDGEHWQVSNGYKRKVDEGVYASASIKGDLDSQDYFLTIPIGPTRWCVETGGYLSLGQTAEIPVGYHALEGGVSDTHVFIEPFAVS